MFPAIGALGIGQISSRDIWEVIEPLVGLRKIETAQRVRAAIHNVFDYAMVHDLVKFNPAQAVAKQIPMKVVIHRPAMTEPKEVAHLLRVVDGYKGSFVVVIALKVSMYVFQRPGEIRAMRWQDVDLVNAEWRYLVTKTKFKHIVPLAKQVVELLTVIKAVTGKGEFVFPSQRNDGRCLSENGVRTALRSMGFANEDITPHGFRTIASTLLNEQGWNPDAIERQLGHLPRDKVRLAYNRAQYLPERKEMMQAWADYLDDLKGQFLAS